MNIGLNWDTSDSASDFDTGGSEWLTIHCSSATASNSVSSQPSISLLRVLSDKRSFISFG